MTPVTFTTAAELRILSVALDDALYDERRTYLYAADDRPIIEAMRARVDAELAARRQEPTP